MIKMDENLPIHNMNRNGTFIINERSIQKWNKRCKTVDNEQNTNGRFIEKTLPK